MKKFVALLFVSIILAGCSNNSAQALTLDEAQKIALAEVDGKVVKAIEETDDGRNYYEFDIIANDQLHELEVDASNGKITKNEINDDYVPSTTESNNQNNTQATIITSEEAQKIAMDRVGNNGYLVKCELDTDDGIQKYEIEIKNGRIEYEIDINASSGEIIKYEEDQN